MPAVVLQEILQCARDAHHFVRLELQFEQLPSLDELNPRDIARNAALLCARCRGQGDNMRSPNDCVVAACAIASHSQDIPMLHDWLNLNPAVARL